MNRPWTVSRCVLAQKCAAVHLTRCVVECGSERVRRWARKRGGSTRRRVTSAVNRGRTAIRGALNRRNNKPKTSMKKKSKLRKYGKYAVAGLAAYGTYKLAKKMSKGLRGAYDQDDCWRHDPFRDAYFCQCEDQCDDYRGAANANEMNFFLVMGISMTLLLS